TSFCLSKARRSGWLDAVRCQELPISVAMAGVRRRPDSCRVVLGVGERLGLGDPGVGPARQTDFFADLVRRVVVELGELPEVEDAEVVQLLLDRTGHAGELLE